MKDLLHMVLIMFSPISSHMKQKEVGKTAEYSTHSLCPFVEPCVVGSRLSSLRKMNVRTVGRGKKKRQGNPSQLCLVTPQRGSPGKWVGEERKTAIKA